MKPPKYPDNAAEEWKPDYSVTPRRVVCAANRHHHSRLIICGARHWDKVMRAQADALGTGFTEWEQGFIDQFGDFLTRGEAWTVAEEQGQIRREVSVPGTLFSENLY
jgi:hypothetical protein